MFDFFEFTIAFTINSARSQSFSVENQEKTIHLMRSTLQFISFSIFFIPFSRFIFGSLAACDESKNRIQLGVILRTILYKNSNIQYNTLLNQYPICFLLLLIFYHESSIQRNLCICTSFINNERKCSL